MLDGSPLRQTTRQWERRGQRGQDTGCSTCPTLQLLGQVEPSVIAIRDACCLQPARRLGTPKNNERCAGRWSAEAVAHHLMNSVSQTQPDIGCPSLQVAQAAAPADGIPAETRLEASSNSKGRLCCLAGCRQKQMGSTGAMRKFQQALCTRPGRKD